MHDALAVAILIGVPLAQVPLVALLSRYVELDGDEPRPRTDRGYVTYGTASARPEEGGDPVCPQCGSPVTDDYEYCGACAGRLPPRHGHR